MPNLLSMLKNTPRHLAIKGIVLAFLFLNIACGKSSDGGSSNATSIKLRDIALNASRYIIGFLFKKAIG